MPYPTADEINQAVPPTGVPDRAKTNAVLQAVRQSLPTGDSRKVVVFNPETGEMAAGLFTADHWSEFPDGAPTTGIWLAAYIPESPEVLGFAQVSMMADENTVPVRTSENEFFTGGRLKAAPGTDPDDCATMVQVIQRTYTAPTSATSPGSAGDFYADSSYIYACIATNTWVRSDASNGW